MSKNTNANNGWEKFNKSLLLPYFLLALLLLFAAYQQHRIWQLSGPVCPARTKRSSVEYAVGNPPGFEQQQGFRLAMSTEKAEVDGQGGSVSFPLFAQFSSKSLRDFCLRTFPADAELTKNCTAENQPKQAPKNDENRTKTTGPHQHRKGHRNKTGGTVRAKISQSTKCPPILSIGPTRLIGRRLHSTGGVVRHGNRWFLTEFATGYTLFQFDLANSTELENREESMESESEDPLAFPTQLHTLSEPFQGTNHAVIGPAEEETLFYELASGRGRLQALQLGTGRRRTKMVYAAKAPLYGFSKETGQENTLLFGHSTMDLETDQSGALWLLFRRPNLTDPLLSPLPHFSMVKLAPDSLKQLDRWELHGVMTDGVVNTFVACGILYTVRLGKEREGGFELQVSPAFDFHSGKLLPAMSIPHKGEGWTTSGKHHISSVQYDPLSDSLAIFDSGNVYNVVLER